MRNIKSIVFVSLMRIFCLLSLLPFIFIIFKMTSLALPHLLGVFTDIPYELAQAVMGSIHILLLVLIQSIPLGVLLGIYLSEFESSQVAKWTSFCVDSFNVTPSLVIGLMIYLCARSLGFEASLFLGSLSLSVFIVPFLSKAVHSILKNIPASTRESAMALGFTKWQIIFRILLPSSKKALITVIVLVASRVVGEVAALFFVLEFSAQKEMLSSNLTIPTYLFQLWKKNDPAFLGPGWAVIFCLMLLILAVNLFVKFMLGRKE